MNCSVVNFSGLDPQRGLAHPQVANRRCPLDRGCQVVLQKAWPWTTVGNMFGECYAPCTLQISFVATTKDSILSQYQHPTIQYFPGAVKIFCRVSVPFLYSFIILFNLSLLSFRICIDYLLLDIRRQTINQLSKFLT